MAQSNMLGGGSRGQSYLGTRANNPANVIEADRNPLITDVMGYAIGTLWINVPESIGWLLTNVEATLETGGKQVATWEELTGTITIPLPIAQGGTNATTMTNTNGVIYYDGTRLVTTTVGSATQVLTSNGPGVAPTFQASSGGSGSWTLIETKTVVDNPFIEFITGITPDFEDFIIVHNDVSSATGGTNQLLFVQISIDGGGSYISTGYRLGNDAAAGLGINSIIDSDSRASGVAFLYNITSGSGYVMASSSATAFNPGSVAASTSSGSAYETPGQVVNALRVIMQDSSNLTGTFSLYSLTQ